MIKHTINFLILFLLGINCFGQSTKELTDSLCFGSPLVYINGVSAPLIFATKKFVLGIDSLTVNDSNYRIIGFHLSYDLNGALIDAISKSNLLTEWMKEHIKRYLDNKEWPGSNQIILFFDFKLADKKGNVVISKMNEIEIYVCN